MNRDLRALELDKILDMLAGETCCADAAHIARALRPSGELEVVRRLVEETDEAALVAALLGEYDVDEATAAAAVKAFVRKLRDNGFLAE